MLRPPPMLSAVQYFSSRISEPIIQRTILRDLSFSLLLLLQLITTVIGDVCLPAFIPPKDTNNPSQPRGFSHPSIMLLRVLLLLLTVLKLRLFVIITQLCASQTPTVYSWCYHFMENNYDQLI